VFSLLKSRETFTVITQHVSYSTNKEFQVVDSFAAAIVTKTNEHCPCTRLCL